MLKSPGGSNFPYYYQGGEIHCLKYGSFFDDERRLLEIMDAEEQFIKQRPGQRLRVWVDLYETKLSDSVVAKFAAQIFGIRGQIVKLAIVGCSPAGRRKLDKALINENQGVPVPCRHFDDPEEAKTWLVSH